jgi:3-oxoacyl-[acyl-carrier-protein] synthase III
MRSRYGSAGISRIAYRLPACRRALPELEAQGRIASPAGVLDDFGFRSCHEIEHHDELFELLAGAGCDLLQDAELLSDDVGMLYLVFGLPVTRTSDDRGLLGRFRYPAARLHHELGLKRAGALAISEQGCSGLLSTLDMAARLLASSESPAALCLAGDALPAGSPREIMYNLMSDAAAALLVERDSPRNRILAFRQQTQTYYWDTPEREQELLAAYFPMAQRAIAACLTGAGLDVSEIDWFVPHNVSLRSWEILAKLLGIPEERVWTRNISRIGHTISCDHAINLADMEREGALTPGDRLLLFTFGFGASWSCMILEH